MLKWRARQVTARGLDRVGWGSDAGGPARRKPSGRKRRKCYKAMVNIALITFEAKERSDDQSRIW